MNKTTVFSILLLACLTITNHSYAQSKSILESYGDYSEAPREIAYTHLNKSTYIEGEMLGFTAYVFDKYTKEPSKMTSNLYCTISDENGKIIKKKLIKVDKGVASNVFDIDSTLSTGIFTFKAYTNWMKNFDEQNHFEQTFKVIDADNLGAVKPVAKKDIQIDLQALGEGGHLLYNVSNSVGIIAKNQFGYGIANAYGSIRDKNGTIVSEFQLNDVGLAKALFTPMINQSYSINLNLNERTITEEIKDIKLYGIVMNLIPSKEKVSLVLRTNIETLKQVKNKTFQIALHNGSDMALTPFTLNDDGMAVLSFPTKALFSGTNIFTIFNDKNQPILERLYFKNEGLNQQKISKVSIKASKDSLDIGIDFREISSSQLSNISISVLPTGTKSYNHHNNLLSQLYIQPYVKGNLENAGKYLQANDRKTAYNLDILMLTQGWSSYDWNNIFTSENKKFIYPFERGIDIVANINGNKNGSYIVYPLAQNNTQLFDVPIGEKEFTIKKSFPNEDDLFRIGYIDLYKKEFKEKPTLYLQYYPSKFATYTADYNVIEENYTANETSINPNQKANAWDNSNITKLDEVVINGKNRHTKIEALAEKATLKRYEIITDRMKLRGMRIDLYLQRLGYVTQFDYFSGTLSITNPRVKWGNPVPLIYLDDALLSTQGVNSDFSLLTLFTTNEVDYIEYEPYGFGGGIRGNAGYIKIYTGPTYQDLNPRNDVVMYDIPLRFSKEKQFYTPKYQYYNTGFFEEYGTIAWHPRIKVDDNGLASLKIFDTKTQNMSLFVEGIINGNQYISQEIKIERDNID